MKKQDHVHKFRRLKYKSGNTIFFCALPDCNVKTNIALALGKRTICWRCGDPFIMNEYSLRLAKPHCENCHKPKDSMTHTEEVASNAATRMIEQANDVTYGRADKTPTLAERLAAAVHQQAVKKEIDEKEKDEDI